MDFFRFSDGEQEQKREIKRVGRHSCMIGIGINLYHNKTSFGVFSRLATLLQTCSLFFSFVLLHGKKIFGAN